MSTPPPPPGWPPPGAHWQAPGYGPPPGPHAHVPPGFPPPGYPPPGYLYRRPTNTMAIMALVLAFVFAPVGLVLGVVARRQIRETGEEGDGLALAAIVIGSVATALFVLGLVVFVAAVASISSGPVVLD